MDHRIPMDIQPIEEDGFHLFIKARLMDADLTLLIDTGASRSVFDRSRLVDKIGEKKLQLIEMEKLSTGLGTSTMKSESSGPGLLRIGDLVIEDYQGVVLEMSHVNESYGLLNMPGIDGVLGSDLLHRFDAVIDYREGVLVLRDG